MHLQDLYLLQSYAEFSLCEYVFLFYKIAGLIGGYKSFTLVGNY